MTQSVFTDRYKQFRLLLVEAREKAGLSQAQLAGKLSRPQSFVSKYECGERRLDVIEFEQIAHALEVGDPIRFLRKLYDRKGSAE